LFAGLVRFDGNAPASGDAERLQALLARRRGGRRSHLQRTPSAIFATSEPGSRHGTLFAASSRLHNCAEVAAAGGAMPTASESECIRYVFETRGDRGIAQFLGGFVFAHWDDARRTLSLARDCFGVEHALFYYEGRGYIAFATHLADLLAMPAVPRELNERMLANLLALNNYESEETVYRGIRRVPSRSILEIDPAGRKLRRYWSPNPNAAGYSNPDDYIERARELFSRSVARTLAGASNIAVQLSGGFDSSAVAATALRLGAAVTGYTGLPPTDLVRPARSGRYLDEGDKVRALMRLHPSLDVRFVIPRGAHARQVDPARDFVGVPLATFAVANLGWFAQIEEAILADGHDQVLTGGLGNLMISCDGNFALAELAKRGRFWALCKEVRAGARGTKQSMVRTLLGEALWPLLPNGAQRALQQLLGRGTLDVSTFSLVNPDIVRDLDLERQWRADGFDMTFYRGGPAVRAHMMFDWGQNERDMAAMHAATGRLAYRSPFRDRELAEFCLAVPQTLYRRGGVRRWFARQVFADRLPPEILTETRRGEQAPNWFESLTARKPVIAAEIERMEASSFACRLFDVPRMKRLLGEWPQNASDAEARAAEYRYGLDRAVHLGQFIRWVEGTNA
jgi:asparagine synthase (glutamine-hydrolysing)